MAAVSYIRKMIEWTFSKICVSSAVNKIAPFDSGIVKSTSEYGDWKKKTKEKRNGIHRSESVPSTHCSRRQFVLAMHEFLSLIYFLLSPFITESIRRFMHTIAFHSMLTSIYIYFFVGFPSSVLVTAKFRLTADVPESYSKRSFTVQREQ